MSFLISLTKRRRWRVEPRKILGTISDGKITFADFKVSAHCHRVHVLDGHLEAVSVAFRRRPKKEQLIKAMTSFRSIPQALNLPSAPQRPVVYLEGVDRPQPRLDRDVERGMATIVGRVRECNVLDYKFDLLGHNTIRGAAGAAILNAELLLAQGWLKNCSSGRNSDKGLIKFSNSPLELNSLGGHMPIQVRIPVQLRSLTKGAEIVAASGSSVQQLIEDMDRNYPGIKDRLCEGDGKLQSLCQYIRERRRYPISRKPADADHREGRDLDIPAIARRRRHSNCFSGIRSSKRMGLAVPLVLTLICKASVCDRSQASWKTDFSGRSVSAKHALG